MAFVYGEGVQIRSISGQYISTAGDTLNGKFKITLDCFIAQYLGNIGYVNVTVVHNGTSLFTIQCKSFTTISNTYFGYDYGVDRNIYVTKYEIPVPLTDAQIIQLLNRFPNEGTLNVTIKTTLYYWNSIGGNKYLYNEFAAGGAIRTPPPSIAEGGCTVSPNNVASGGSADFPYYLKGISKAAVVFDTSKIDLSTLYGASIYKFKLTVGDTLYQVNVGDKTSVTFDTSILNTVGEIACTGSFVDSRGNEYVILPETITVYDYFKPTLSSVNAVRCDSEGIPSGKGRYFMAKAKEMHADVGGHNTVILQIRYRETGGEYTDYIPLISNEPIILGDGELLQTATYSIEISVTDLAGFSARFVGFVAADIVTVSLKDGGNAVAIGTYANSEPEFSFTVAFDTYLRGDLIIGSTRITEGQLQRLLNLI